MEQLFSNPLALFTLFFLTLVLSLIFLKHHKTKTKSNLKLPPGPWPLPFIGNLHQLIGSLPHHGLRDLSRRYGSLMFLQLGENPTIIASSADVAREIMKTHDTNFAERRISTTINIFTHGGKGIVFGPYGEYWRQLRKICNLEVLSQKRVQSFRAIREEEVSNLIQYISSCSSRGEYVNLSKRLVMVVNDMSARIIIGSQCKNQEMFLREVGIALKFWTGFNLSDLFPSSRLASLIGGAEHEAKRCQRAIDCFLDVIIEQHRKKTTLEGDTEREDLVGVLLRIYEEEKQQQNSMDIETVKNVIFEVFAGGTETSARTLEWAMSELIRSPRAMEKAQSEVRELLKGCSKVSESDLVKLNYLHLVIKETLRLHPPTLLIPRRCRETCRIFGYDIPEGTTVLLNVWAIGRDPKYWKDPEEFNPDRFIGNNVDFKGTDFEFLPFGSGRRFCPGMSFGLANVELLLASLLYHFDWKLPNGDKPEQIDMLESFKIAVQRKTPLQLLPVAYKSDIF